MADVPLRGRLPLPHSMRIPRDRTPGGRADLARDIAETWAIGSFWQMAAEEGYTVKGLPTVTWSAVEPSIVVVDGVVDGRTEAGGG